MAPSHPLRVLVVEDHDDSRTTMRMLLAIAHGHVVYEAAEGFSAIQIAVEKRPDAALIDLGLPGMDGYEVARQIRNTVGDGMFLIALTGYDTEEDRQRTEDAGFDVHMVKPVDSGELTRLLAQVAATRVTGE
jgi:two-component system, sensor histidine kinase